jgi:hypothetical protein
MLHIEREAAVEVRANLRGILEFLTWMSICQSIFIVRDRISLTKMLNVSHNDNKA